MLYKKTKDRTARRGAIFAAAVALSALGGSALAQTTITIESWRTDDSDIWNNQIIPAFEKVNPDLTNYVVGKAVDALFDQIAKEEANIRANPLARTTEILKKVFGGR